MLYHSKYHLEVPLKGRILFCVFETFTIITIDR